MTEEDFIVELRRAAYGPYSSYWKLREALATFLRQHRDDTPPRLSTVDQILSGGMKSNWIYSLIPGEDAVSQWCIVEDPSITTQRDMVFKAGEYPESVYYRRSLEKARTEEIPELKKRLADEVELEVSKEEIIRSLEDQLAAAKETITNLTLNSQTQLSSTIAPQVHVLLGKQIEIAEEQNTKLAQILKVLNQGGFQPLVRTSFGNTYIPR